MYCPRPVQGRRTDGSGVVHSSRTGSRQVKLYVKLNSEGHRHDDLSSSAPCQRTLSSSTWPALTLSVHRDPPPFCFARLPTTPSTPPLPVSCPLLHAPPSSPFPVPTHLHPPFPHPVLPSSSLLSHRARCTAARARRGGCPRCSPHPQTPGACRWWRWTRQRPVRESYIYPHGHICMFLVLCNTFTLASV